VIDATQVKQGTKIRMVDGQVISVTGAYMSTDGIVFRGKSDPGNLCERNCLLSDIQEIIVEVPHGTGA
jgi:hypothetical protein